jgi:glycosyltransferase involved in cell wall biosynthesis
VSELERALPRAEPPEVSVVIPVYDEEAILYDAVAGSCERLSARGLAFELVLAENGSRDGTAGLLEELERRHPEVRHLSIPEPNYGRALRLGILAARGAIVVTDEIDLLDVEFQLAGIELVRSGVDLVIGSKLMAGARDQRPFSRHAASIAYTGLLRALTGFRGTDTHGPKVFRRERLLPLVRACRVERDVFASELVVRSEREGLVIREIPLRIKEKRPPTIGLLRRVPNVLSNLARLAWASRQR